MKTKDLMSVLEALMPATSNKALLEQTDHIVFNGDQAMTYNDRICISHPIQTGIKCSVIASDIFKVVKGIKEEDVDLRIENDMLILETDTTYAELSTEIGNRTVEEVFASLDLSNLDFYDLPDNFIEGISLCRFSISKDVNSDRNLFCARIAGNKIYTTDGYRITDFVLSEEMDDVLIPYSAVSELINPYYKLDGYCIKDDWCHFENEEHVTFSCRTMLDNGNFPDTETLFNNVNADVSVKLPSSLQEVLESIKDLCAGDSDISKKVDIEIQNKVLTCIGHKERGTIKKTLAIASDTDFQFSVNPIFLSQVLDHVSTINLDTQMNVAVLQTEGFRHLISLPVKS